VAERIATFDNDGCLWCEQPMYVQLAFALDRSEETCFHFGHAGRQPGAGGVGNSGDRLGQRATAGGSNARLVQRIPE